jgi:hypothetical protein
MKKTKEEEKEDLPFFNHANKRVGDPQRVQDIEHLLVHLRVWGLRF